MARTSQLHPKKDTKGAETGLVAPGKEHIFAVRVYYEDTDAGGVVYYANYLRYAERARTEMLRSLGIESSALMEGHGVAFAVRRCEADYFRPARLDDALEVRTRLLDVGGASVDAVQRILQAGRDGAEVARLRLRLACMSLSGGPARIPAEVRRRLEDFNNPER